VELQLRVQDLLPEAVGDAVLRLLAQHETELLEGAIVTLAANGTRVRVLPLHAGWIES
jgi:hypothetical protein